MKTKTIQIPEKNEVNRMILSTLKIQLNHENAKALPKRETVRELTRNIKEMEKGMKEMAW